MTKTLVSYCTNRIAPAAAALVLALTGGSALATVQGQGKITQKLNASFIPTIKATTTLQSAKSADLLLAITLAIKGEPTLTAAEIAGIAEGALEPVNSKVRADKDKIAGQVLATVLAARPDLSDQEIADVASKIFNVNAGASNVKFKLTATGQAATLAAAIKAAPNDNAANLIGQSLYAGAQADTTIITLLANTATALGGTTTNAAAANSLANVVDGLFDDGVTAATNRSLLIKLAAEKAAAKNITAAGALFAGLVKNNPVVSGDALYDTPAELTGLATLIVTDTKLAKAFGEALAAVVGGIPAKGSLYTSLVTSSGKASNGPIIAQGLLRAGTAAEANAIMDAATATPIADKAKFAAVAMVGTGDDFGKVTNIINKLTPGLDTVKKTALGASAIGAVATATPAAAEVVTQAIFASGGFADDTARIKFGTDIVTKLKVYASAGYMAKEIAETSGTQTQANVASIAAQIMKKGVKAAPDIANQVSNVTAAGTPVTFAQAIVNTTFGPKNTAIGNALIQPAAVGVSIANPRLAGDITAGVITHNITGDKAALAKAATVGGAVAKAVDEEAASDIGRALSVQMSTKGDVSGRPIKTSLVNALATALAKEVQAKPGVRLVNRMDELGEIAAVLTKGVLTQATGKAQATLISGIGSAILKSLSKTATLSANPNEPTALAAKLVAANSTGKADLWEARDIAGSIAAVIKSSGLSDADKTALLGTSSGPDKKLWGPLLTAFAKLSGKAGSPTYNAVLAAFDEVRQGINLGRFETGEQVDLFDPETDNRNG